MELWTEIRTAMIVGRLGTVRAAAHELGVHRSTATRHIDNLEDRLGTKLFLRHKHGYTPTQDGLALQSAAEGAGTLIEEFVTRTHGSSTV